MSDELRPIDAAASATSQRLDWRLMLPVFIIVSLDAASSGAILPILPFYLTTLGASPLVLGLVLGAEALSQLIRRRALRAADTGPGWPMFQRASRSYRGAHPRAIPRLITLSASASCWRRCLQSSSSERIAALALSSCQASTASTSQA
ncbi:hypothetical protein CUJ84_Chr001916 [Rhizobium leguminosarum]|uniref:MFS transporter n=1 Tax=Rhizobium leguminosarum TaxID=384 RepID=A0A2K9Z235_RHILE|nr:hypothetical protein CUJ84_Chr001916 [Rhizobium leguminosarum]